MSIKDLFILGKSEATITMILDNLESCQSFPRIKIINNLELTFEKEYRNEKFDIEILKSFEGQNEETSFVLGGFQTGTKRRLFENFGLSPSKFATIIHASSSVSSTVKLGNGCLINSLVSIAAWSELGDFVSVNRNASVGHHTVISGFVTLNPGCHVAGNVFIGENTQIGMGANIIDGTKIGRNSIVGAGALVTKDVPDHVMVYGSPAKVIKEI
ncbi:hypothetical protein GVN16_14685 [Emticicia sp. CRIBPO]|uniref:hypothetical protein n=1 Tax=Emticicia sp. CRIBPO TaxID=2683258 RepID=UPI0014129E15|nr:hypothetical protein [Emticicia sp. CRIBPO]NBA87016.1 hypothetical protein [Emticicia sp. CRIBPO]